VTLYTDIPYILRKEFRVKKNPAAVSLFTVSELAGNCNALGVHKIQELEDIPKLLSVLARKD
jgi:hypothetical protein